MNRSHVRFMLIALISARSIVAAGHGVPVGDPIDGPEPSWPLVRRSKAFPLSFPKLTRQEIDLYMLGVGNTSGVGIQPFLVGPLPRTVPASRPKTPPAQVNASLFPWSTAGVLFFVDAKSQDGFCTAEVVGDGTVIITAAHCVQDRFTGKNYKGFRFFRAYQNSAGVEHAIECQRSWSSFAGPKPNFAVDYAFLKLRLNNPLEEFLGLHVGEWNDSVTSVGYPLNYGGGKQLHSSVGAKGRPSNGIVAMQPNLMSDGASGGSWIADPSGLNLVVGVNSFEEMFDDDVIYGPAFDDSVMLLYEFVRNGCK